MWLNSKHQKFILLLSVAIGLLTICCCSCNTYSSNLNRPQKEILYLATFSPSSNLKSAIKQINDANSKYIVEIIDFEYPNGRMDLLNSLENNQGPDFFYFKGQALNYTDILNYTENLSPYLINSDQINPSVFVPSLYNALVNQNELKVLPISFKLHTCISSNDLLAQTTISLSDISEYANQHNLHMFSQTLDSTSLLTHFFRCELTNSINFTDKTSRFNSETYRTLLDSIKRTYKSNNSLDKKESILYYDPNLINLQQIQYIKKQFGDDYYYWGYHSQQCGNAFEVLETIGMFESFSMEEEKWFILSELFLLLTRESDYGFPVLQRSLDEKFNDSIGLYDITKEDIDKITNLIKGTDSVYFIDLNIESIYVDRIKGYLSDKITDEEVLTNIDNEIQNYIQSNIN